MHEVYVDHAGDDANPGTRYFPMRTIIAGLAALPHGGTLHLAPGYWKHSVPIDLAQQVALVGAGVHTGLAT